MPINPHGDAFILNTKSLIMTIENLGARPIEIRVAPDVLRKYASEIKHFMRTPERPGDPPLFLGLPLRQDPAVKAGTLIVVTQHVVH